MRVTRHYCPTIRDSDTGTRVTFATHMLKGPPTDARAVRLALLYMTPLTDDILYDFATVAQFGIALGLGYPIENVYSNYTLLEWAVEHKQTIHVNILIQAGANVNSTSGYPVICAAWNGFDVILEQLIEAGADVNVNHHGKTPVVYALEYGTARSVDILLQAGAVLPCIAEHIVRKSYVDRDEKIRILLTHTN